MPSDQAVAREARLVRNLANWLRSQGKQCTVAGWPDRDPSPWPAGLTVEAVLAVGPDGAQVQWAVDVMTVPVPASTAAGMAEARQQLHVPAAQLAEGAHRAVTISIRIPAGDSAERKAYYQEVLTRVEEALRTGSDYYDASGKDPATQVLLSDGEFSVTRQGRTAQYACTWSRLPEAPRTCSSSCSRRWWHRLTRSSATS
jgi:hypothetical protein